MNLIFKKKFKIIIMIEIQNDNLENIKLFQNIEKHDTFSKYSDELNRIFGERTFKKFFFNLKMNRKLGCDNFLKIFEKNKLSFKPLCNFDYKKYQNFITELEKREEDNKIKRINFKNKFKFSKKDINENSLEKEKSKSNSKEKIFIPSVPDIGRYNPNYNSIRKNEPKIIFSRNDFKINLKLINNNLKEKKKKICYSSSETKLNNIKKIKIKDNNLKSRNKNRSQIILTQNLKSKNSLFSLNKNNHSLKFDDYSKRKTLINESTIYSHISNSNPNIIKNHIKGLVEFDRMSSYSKLKKTKIPPLGTYDPKYDFIEIKSPQIIIQKNLKMNKRIKLKKILCEYNVPLQYELIKNLNL